MGKSTHDNAIDSLLTYISGNATQIHVCSAEPTTRAEAVTTYNLASGTVTSGDFTLANGDVSGRKHTVAAQAGLSISATGSGNHVAITSGTELLDVTTCTAIALTSGGTVDIGAFDHEVTDPS